MLLVELTSLESRHLARALHLYQERIRVDGGRLPPGLADLATRLAARDGQEQPMSDVGVSLEDDAAMQQPILLDVRDAAAILSLSERTVGRLIASGSLHSVKVGRMRRVHRADLVEFANQLREGSPDADPGFDDD